MFSTYHERGKNVSSWDITHVSRLAEILVLFFSRLSLSFSLSLSVVHSGSLRIRSGNFPYFPPKLTSY